MLGALYRRLIQLGKVSGAVTFLLAAPYALFEYIQSRNAAGEQFLQAQRAAQVEHTVDLFKLYNSDPLTAYRAKITKSVFNNQAQLAAAAVDENSLLAAQLKVIQQDDLGGELFSLLDFYDGVSTCVINSLCDDISATRMFQPGAAHIYLYFYQFIVRQRSATGGGNFGLGIQAIALSKVAPP